MRLTFIFSVACCFVSQPTLKKEEWMSLQNGVPIFISFTQKIDHAELGEKHGISFLSIPVSWPVKAISCGGFYYSNYLYWRYNYKSWKLSLYCGQCCWILGYRWNVLICCFKSLPLLILLRVHFGIILCTNFNIDFYILY